MGNDLAQYVRDSADARIIAVETRRKYYVDATRPQKLAFKKPKLVEMLRALHGTPPCVDCLADSKSVAI